ncbi:penicillin-binding protein 2 [Aliidiomarina iranensis]|uniref:Peptidoglycan D,D-transpeptidase MrdA n=1 Tax=Aliidiomarina iranensis TaxID=1434071 RepID=A0A432VWY1_9GAMM|nr:penicillin-binding protein 2 [Aliidiomarina iranensis]RUO21201.1 penicillin-binding protein 2 [Aliidiomarina iranensis]
MKKRVPIRNHQAESALFGRRAIVSLSIVAIVFLGLLANLYQLQVTSFQEFQTRSNSNRIVVLPVAPNRGLIYDRNGSLLADNTPVYSLEVSPAEVNNIADTIERLVALLSLPEDTADTFYVRLNQPRRFPQVTLFDNLNEQQVALFVSAQHQFPGINIEGRLQRFYPHRDLLTHTLGYVGRINQQDVTRLREQELYAQYAATRTIGKLGIERYYENILHGEVGYQTVEVNNRGRVVRTLDFNPPTPGKDIHLEIDIGYQKVARHQLRGRRGAIIVLDANTGGVLAMYSNPGYDPNLFVGGISSNEYRELLNNSANPLINRATQGRYPPASTIKPHLGLLGLHLGVITADSTVWDPGWYQLEGVERRFRDWRQQGHGWVDITKAIAESCNTYYYDLSFKLGIDNISSFMSEMGFGERTGIDITEESTALMPDRGWKRARYNEPWYQGETLSVGIGQSFWTVTPLQLATSTSIIATEGRRLQPRLLHGIGEQNAIEYSEIIEKPPLVISDSAHWQTIKNAMRATITDVRGTARMAFINAPYTAAGKTGTAQVVALSDETDERPETEDVIERFRDNATYVGYAPAEYPEIVVAIAIENVGGGGRNAAPVSRALMDYYFADDAGRTAILQAIADEEVDANN